LSPLGIHKTRFILPVEGEVMNRLDETESITRFGQDQHVVYRRDASLIGMRICHHRHPTEAVVLPGFDNRGGFRNRSGVL
jgi:hypothetical protein